MEGIAPGKYANAELMKIPNFLHLTPAHVKKHCEALKREFFPPLLLTAYSVAMKNKKVIAVEK